MILGTIELSTQIIVPYYTCMICKIGILYSF